MRCLNDTFVIQREDQKQNFLDHINNIVPAIKFTLQGNQENGTVPFLDTLVKPESDNSLSVTVYRNPCTLTNTYNGIATIISLLSTLWQAPLPIGPKWFALDQSFSLRNYSTLGECWPSVSTLSGHWTRWKGKSTTGKTVTPKGRTQKKAPAIPVVTPQGGTPTRKNKLKVT